MSEPIIICTIAEYLNEVSRIQNQTPNGVFVFRGQKSCNWRLESSAERRLKNNQNQKLIDDKQFIEYHKDLLKKCKLKNFDKREGKQLDELELLADLQHHGAATCLMDFTRSTLIALWFACEKSETNGKVFMVNIADETNFREIIRDDIKEKTIGPILEFKTRKTDNDQMDSDSAGKFSQVQTKPNFWHWTPAHLNERITAQHSLFLFGLPGKKLSSEEIIIKPKEKKEIRRKLEKTHNIHEESLFPDFVGFAATQRHTAPYHILDAEEYLRRGASAFQRGDFRQAI